jgi:hypothetical protein
VRPVAAGPVIVGVSYQGFGRIILKTAVAGLEMAHLTKIALTRRRGYFEAGTQAFLNRQIVTVVA